jgi:hypothetical protein
VRVGTINSTYQPLSTANSAAIAAYDITNGGATGVYATSAGGIGVLALSSTGTGVDGVSSTGIGVKGASNAAADVVGISGAEYGGVFNGGKAPLHLGSGVTTGSPTSGGHNPGDFYVDSAGVLWYCTTLGTPGTWIRLCGPQSGVPGGALNYLAAPIRIFDSRVGQPAPLPTTKAPLAGGTTYTIQVTGTTVGGLSVPAGATGVFGNLTVTDTQGGGDLILFPHGAPQPLTSNINYEPGKTIANSVNVGLSTDGKIDLYVHVSGTDVIIDIAGYVA